MADLEELNQWEDKIYQFSTNDDIVGGADGIDNLPHKQLANRTQYLKQQLDQSPLYPEILTADKKLAITNNGDNTITINANQNFWTRNSGTINTDSYDVAERTFAYDPAKTYHLRWDATNNFRLLDVVDATYNPSALTETHTSFDTTYDDMLVATVVTGTITSLINSAFFTEHFYVEMTLVNGVFEENALQFQGGLTPTATVNLTYARKPFAVMSGLMDFYFKDGVNYEMNVGCYCESRSQLHCYAQSGHGSNDGIGLWVEVTA